MKGRSRMDGTKVNLVAADHYRLLFEASPTPFLVLTPVNTSELGRTHYAVFPATSSYCSFGALSQKAKKCGYTCLTVRTLAGAQHQSLCGRVGCQDSCH